jgi:hypothetical protein
MGRIGGAHPGEERVHPEREADHPELARIRTVDVDVVVVVDADADEIGKGAGEITGTVLQDGQDWGGAHISVTPRNNP